MILDALENINPPNEALCQRRASREKPTFRAGWLLVNKKSTKTFTSWARKAEVRVRKPPLPRDVLEQTKDAKRRKEHFVQESASAMKIFSFRKIRLSERILQPVLVVFVVIVALLSI